MEKWRNNGTVEDMASPQPRKLKRADKTEFLTILRKIGRKLARYINLFAKNLSRLSWLRFIFRSQCFT